MQEMAGFNILKAQLLQKYREQYPGWEGSIHDFKGKQIANFQDLMLSEVGGRVSEKWFYTHIKPRENNKLPRIDTLDMLCTFLGYQDWEDFKYQHLPPKTKEVEVAPQVELVAEKKKIPYQLIGLLGGLILLIAMSFLWLNASKDFEFCFVDADLNTPITDTISISILQANESPRNLQTDRNGCFQISDIKGPLVFIVKAPYYKVDTIRRQLKNRSPKEIIKLHLDDYALMIHLFSTGKMEDIQKRRRQLDGMFAAEAQIFQVDQNHLGMELYNKEEFINKLTIPINSLKDIEVLDTKYDSGKIISLRFRQ